MTISLKVSSLLWLSAFALAAVADEPEFDSVDSVFEHLESQEGVQIRSEQGWKIADDPKNMTLWTFTTEGHSAHPAVFMRKVVQEDGIVRLRTWGLCEADKDSCDTLGSEFEELNESIRQQMRR